MRQEERQGSLHMFRGEKGIEAGSAKVNANTKKYVSDCDEENQWKNLLWFGEIPIRVTSINEDV